MPDSVKSLIVALSEKGDAMLEMLGVLREERRCVEGLDMSGLERSGREKERIMERMLAMNSNCRKLLARAGARRGASDADTLSQLMAVADRNEADELGRVRAGLLSSAGDIDREAALNRGILERSINSMEKTMAFCIKLLNNSDTYRSNGAPSDAVAGGRIIRREV